MLSSWGNTYIIVSVFLVLFNQMCGYNGFCLPDQPCATKVTNIKPDQPCATKVTNIKPTTTHLSSTSNISIEESSTEPSDVSIEELEESLIDSLNASREDLILNSTNASEDYYDYQYDENEVDYEFEITSRRLTYGRSCFSSAGYFGSCSKSKYCVNRSYSYSRTCGFSYICCKNQNTITRNRTATRTKTSTITRPTIRTRPTRWTTTRRTTRRTTTRRTTRRTTTRRTTRRAITFRTRTTPRTTTIDFFEPQVDTGNVPSPFESLNTAGCGTSIEEFIFGGQVAKKGALPFMVSFVETFGPRRRKQVENFCGGVLISARHVLTAAHCFSKVRPADWKRGRVDVRLGLIDITDKESPHTRVNIASVKIHENYEERQVDYFNPIHDIAVVTLDRSIRLGRDSGVNTVCLPTSVTNKPNRKGLVAGWGTTTQGKKKNGSVKKLRFAYITEFDREICNNKYNDLIRSKGSPIKLNIDTNMLCAGNNISDTCTGDSGGPLLWIDSEFRYAVAGIVSFGPASCGNVVPGVYTKVQNYLGWIKEQIQ